MTEFSHNLRRSILNNMIFLQCSIETNVLNFSGKKEDLASSSEDEDSGKGETRTVTTSLSAVLGLIKESAQEDNERARHSAEKQMIGPEDPRMKKIPDTITNPWDNLDTKSKVRFCRSRGNSEWMIND